MSWIWWFFASIGRFSQGIWSNLSEQIREAELRRMREQGQRGMSSDDNSQTWDADDPAYDDEDDWDQNSGWDDDNDGWEVDTTDANGDFDSNDMGFDDYGGSDFGDGFDGGGDGGD